MREFSAYRVILVVNVASECGYTDKNYRELQELQENYSDEGEKCYVTFPMFSKVDVNGDKAHPLFKFLTKRLDGFVTNDIKWNFTKFLIINHEPVKRYGTTTSPLELNDIVQALHVSQHVNEFDDGRAMDGDDDLMTSCEVNAYPEDVSISVDLDRYIAVTNAT
ncbi:unnamed protein product [Peronospora destructor]|uniref:Glutathione peroxidase n=1 Tax=Peronospora destructor TaxID=86335 RepID=A0AAV0VED9_9STRA|nr:unnamed protein product [Peronospora destructor]